MGDLRGNDEDVPFDWGGADQLVATANSAASRLDWAAAAWSARARTASEQFRGVFSRIFDSNAVTAAGDAREIARGLRDLATATQRLKHLAEEEQERRVEARQWYAQQESLSRLDKGLDAIGDFFTGDDSTPEVRVAQGSPGPITVQHPGTGPRETPSPGGGGGGGGGGTSSAKPDDLFSFADSADAATDDLTSTSQSVSAAHSSFTANTQWGRVEAQGLVSGFTAYLELNRADARWARIVARAFEAAGSRGSVSTLADSAVASALAAGGVSASRVDLQIDPPVAYGEQPTTGYADDPVNTATGNFTHTEVDLGFVGGTATLGMRRTYNALSHHVGDVRAVQPFGPGWSTWTDARLDLDVHGDGTTAAMTLAEGRQIQFARETDADGAPGWGRAIGDNLWLAALGDTSAAGHVVTDNRGGRWTFDSRGRLTETSRGAGTGVRLTWDESDRVAGLDHERGRWIEPIWSTAHGHDRVTGLRSSDGREVAYDYDDRGRLVAMTSEGRTRSYTWADSDPDTVTADDQVALLRAVTDPDGVVELDNTYDDRGRVRTQRSPHGRLSRYAYLDSRITVVSDADGTRSNTWVADHRGRLVSVVDAHDQRQSTAYDRHGNPVMITGRDGAVTVRSYDDRGLLTRQRDPGGADFSLCYDELDRLTSLTVSRADEELGATFLRYDGGGRHPSEIVDGEGGVSRFSWSDGLLVEAVDPTGVRVAFEHDAHGDLIATTDAEGRTARLERDALGRVTGAISNTGDRTTFRYDHSGVLAERIDADGGTWTFERTSAGRLRAITDPMGARTAVEHDEAGDVSQVIDPLGHGTTQHFDDLGQLASVELPDGSTWRYTHDALSRLVEVAGPDGGRWQRAYDETGELTSTTDPTGVVRQVETGPADGAARDRGETAVTVADALLSVTTRLDVLGRVVAQVRPDGSTERRRHDRCGRVVEVVDEAGGSTQLIRDAAGRVTEIRTPGGQTIRMAYDACGRLASRTTTAQDGSDAVETFEHGVDGRLAKITAPTGEETTWTYDALGRVTRHHRPGVGTTTFERDAVGRITTISDPSNGRRQLTYDAAGRLISATDANGGVTRFELDELGRVVSVIDPLGAHTERAYDVLGRLVAETDPLGRTRTWAYDAAGRLAEHVDATGARTTWTHDASGRTKTRKSITADGADTMTVYVARDIVGRRLQLAESGSRGARKHVLTFDPRGLLVRRTRDGAGVSWTYDADGRAVGITLPDGSTTRKRYAPDGLFARVEHPLLGAVDLTRDASGRVISAVALTDEGSRRYEWRYAAGWLSTVTISATATDPGSHTWVERDEDGRVASVRREGATSVTSYAFDAARQLICVSTRSSRTHYRYDAAGRLVAETIESGTADGSSRTAVERRFDLAGQLLETCREGAVTTHTYDAAGRRTGDRRPDGSAREYSWDLTGALVAITTTDAGGVRSTRALAVDALGELAAIDGIATWWDPTGPWHVLLALGDAPVIDAGPLTGFGGAWSSPGWRPTGTGAGDDAWQPNIRPDRNATFESTRITPAGELVLDGVEWLHARAYDPATHSFLSRDPVSPVLAAGWAGNPYAYAGNDPVHASDPNGLTPISDVELAALALGLTGSASSLGVSFLMTYGEVGHGRAFVRYSRAADELARARRSGHPGRYARGNAPGARELVREWRSTAGASRRLAKILGPAGVAVDVGAGVYEVSQGASPGRTSSTTLATIGGAAAVVGGAAIFVPAAPVAAVAVSAAVVGAGAAAGAGKLWDSLPDDVTDAVDARIEQSWDFSVGVAQDAWDATSETAVDAWDATRRLSASTWSGATDTLDDAWEGLSGWL